MFSRPPEHLLMFMCFFLSLTFVSLGEGFRVGFRGGGRGGFPLENKRKGKGVGMVRGGGGGTGKGTGKSMRKLCRNYPSATYPSKSARNTLASFWDFSVFCVVLPVLLPMPCVPGNLSAEMWLTFVIFHRFLLCICTLKRAPSRKVLQLDESHSGC